jgi:hypothetical protein
MVAAICMRIFNEGLVILLASMNYERTLKGTHII